MRKPVTLSCIALLCSLLLAPLSFAAAPDRGGSLRVRADARDDTLLLWRAHSRLQRNVARLLGLLPFSPPVVSPDLDDDPIRGGLGLSDDPDPTGARGEGDDEQGGGTTTSDGGQEAPADSDNHVFHLGRR